MRQPERPGADVSRVSSIAPRQLGVIIVEDDPDMQWRLARLLTVRGTRVVGTSTGSGALAVIAQWPVDLVLVDDDLPGMSGLEVARRIHESRPDVPVVLMTQTVTHELRTAARLAGAALCIEKPTSSDAIGALVEAVVEDARAESAE